MDWTPTIDVRDLADEVDASASTALDPEAAPEESTEAAGLLADAREWLAQALAENLPDDEMADRLRRMADIYPVLVREDHWAEYMQEYAASTDLLARCPGLVARNINWESMAKDYRSQGWTFGTLGGHTYWAMMD